jgi:hypothetical protein
MAYVNQDIKSQISKAIKPILAKYGIKGSLSVRNHMSIVLTLQSGKIDFIGNSNRVCSASRYQVSNGFTPNTNGYTSVNKYWYQDHYDGVAKEFITEAIAALQSAGWYDRTDAMTDYFDIAYYIDINIGKWNKPYIVQ